MTTYSELNKALNAAKEEVDEIWNSPLEKAKEVRNMIRQQLDIPDGKFEIREKLPSTITTDFTDPKGEIYFDPDTKFWLMYLSLTFPSQTLHIGIGVKEINLGNHPLQILLISGEPKLTDTTGPTSLENFEKDTRTLIESFFNELSEKIKSAPEQFRRTNKVDLLLMLRDYRKKE
jgi:hypothetical protein